MAALDPSDSPPGSARSSAPAVGAFAGGTRRERQAWLVAGISLAVMAGEIAGGAWLNSLALISDGVHTATHAAVMIIAGAAYMYARRRADDPRFRFGPGKVTDLAAFASGVALAMTAFILAAESVGRLISPEPIRFREAAAITGLSLAVSLLSAALLRRAHASVHVHDGVSRRQGRDLNLWAAYLHMVADVITSVIALGALLAGVVTGWMRLDAAVGVLNAAVVAAFSVRLLRAASAALLDYDPERAAPAAQARRRPSGGGAAQPPW